jgi:short-subunit dehydrogenase
VVREVIDQHGRLDILVNNGEITVDKIVHKMTDEDWLRVIAVNLSGAFFLSQTALEHMMGRGTGRIINISSATGEIGGIGQANYAASKSGLFGLTKSLARETVFMKVLDRVGLKVDEIDVFEVNEAFAAQVLAVVRELDLPSERTNPNGSGISLGHPVGASGAILVVKSLYELKRTGGRYALNTMCIGGGQGIATIFERA